MSNAATVTVMLGRNAIFETESDFTAWVGYVSDRIGQACGFPVYVSARGKSDIQALDIRVTVNVDDDMLDYESIKETVENAINVLSEEFIACWQARTRRVIVALAALRDEWEEV